MDAAQHFFKNVYRYNMLDQFIPPKMHGWVCKAVCVCDLS